MGDRLRFILCIPSKFEIFSGIHYFFNLTYYFHVKMPLLKLFQWICLNLYQIYIRFLIDGNIENKRCF